MTFGDAAPRFAPPPFLAAPPRFVPPLFLAALRRFVPLPFFAALLRFVLLFLAPPLFFADRLELLALFDDDLRFALRRAAARPAAAAASPAAAAAAAATFLPRPAVFARSVFRTFAAVLLALAAARAAPPVVPPVARRAVERPDGVEAAVLTALPSVSFVGFFPLSATAHLLFDHCDRTSRDHSAPRRIRASQRARSVPRSTIDFVWFSHSCRSNASRSSAPRSSLPAPRLLYTQKLLDRVLFVAFAEDRGLLPAETLRRAFAHRDPYNPRTQWETFKGLFQAIDGGSGALGIPGYNGGLFARDPGLDRLQVPDEVFAEFKRLGDYDYRSPPAAIEEGAVAQLVDVEILGHIFEQSITDLERIEQELAGGSFAVERVSRRRREGAFYTPRVVTRFIVGHALHRVLDERFEALRRKQQARAEGTAVKALDEPRAYDPTALNKPQQEALLRFWDAWIGEVERVRVLDPAC